MDKLAFQRSEGEVATVPRSADFAKLETIKVDILDSIKRNAPKIGARNPMIGGGPKDFSWQYPEIGYFWTDPFWAGELWLSYMLTGEQAFANMARIRTNRLSRVLDNPLWVNHDLGFKFSLTAVADYKMTGNEQARELALKAAHALTQRFNWVGQYLLAWTSGPGQFERAQALGGKTIIDSMQNLSLLLWAHSETSLPAFRDVALGQAETVRKYLIRDDFSSYHTYDFDLVTNQPICGKTCQGYADESCWSRGQAWAIHGFAQMAENTGDMTYAETSANLADYMMGKIADDLVPQWDYLLPADEIQYKDTSAGSITASGLLMLGDVFGRTGDTERADRYWNCGMKMLLALREKYDLCANKEAQGLLSDAASDVHAAERTGNLYLANAMLPYGDYYYFEAVLRAQGHREFFW